VLAWALRHWRYESGAPLVFTMDDFVRFVDYADDRSGREAQRFWFGCLDYDGDGRAPRRAAPRRPALLLLLLLLTAPPARSPHRSSLLSGLKTSLLTQNNNNNRTHPPAATCRWRT
jgi:hypothetical protein